MKHEDKKKCILCFAPLSGDEISSGIAMGNDNCTCWREYVKIFRETDHGALKQSTRERLAIKAIRERKGIKV